MHPFLTFGTPTSAEDKMELGGLRDLEEVFGHSLVTLLGSGHKLDIYLKLALARLQVRSLDVAYSCFVYTGDRNIWLLTSTLESKVFELVDISHPSRFTESVRPTALLEDNQGRVSVPVSALRSCVCFEPQQDRFAMFCK